MLLRNPISSTKKFIRRTIESFKSFLSKANMYERLPKTPPFHPFSCGRDAPDGDIRNKDLDNFYSEFTHQWDSNKGRVKNKGGQNKKPFLFTITQKTQADTSQKMVPVAIRQTEEFCSENQAGRREILMSNKPNYMSQGKRQSPDLCSRSVRERRLCSVAEKLKELELVDGGSSVDHSQDVEEILHYYSRLTCPAYLDIVDKFFTEMCAEFFSSQPSPLVYSTPKLP